MSDTPIQRVIKFRAWELDDKKMYLLEELFKGDKLAHLAYADMKTISGKGNQVFMQFTGLKDKNDVEIYEGDIIKDSDGGKFEIRYMPYDHSYNHRGARKAKT